MKGRWTTDLIAAAIIGLLTLFVWLQTGWMSEAREAERERMQRRADADARAFAEDFNREIQAIYFNFQLDPAGWESGDSAELNERYEFWKSRTAYPDIISEITYLPSSPDAKLLRYDTDEKRLEAIETSDYLLQLLSQLDTDRPRQFFEEQDTLLIPLFGVEQPVEKVVIERLPRATALAGISEQRISLRKPLGHLAIKLNREVIVSRVLPSLADKHFPNGDYVISITDKEGSGVFGVSGREDKSDASAGLFDLTPDSMMFFGAADTRQPRVMISRNTGVILDQVIAGAKPAANGNESIKPEIKGDFSFEFRNTDGNRQRSAIIRGSATEAPPWQLDVRHTAGSIAQYIEAERRRGLLLTFAVYLLIAGSILAVVISANRVRRFAQRQVDFVSGVSHEFRTPLAVIYSAGENLADGVASDRGQIVQYGELIKGEGKKLSNMVEQILEFAGARSGKRKYNPEPVNVADLVADAVSECRPVLDEGRFDPVISIADGLPTIEADKAALSQALQNLINNAVKYSGPGSWLGISAENGDGELRITVEDRGIGIPKRDIKHIFEPFYRSKIVVDSQIHGNGLGLALVKEIAEAHGGTVGVESEEGKGSRFTIKIPLRHNQS